MSAPLGFAWRWSWVVTLPLTALLVTWGAATWERYASMRLRYGSGQSDLHAIGRMELLHGLRQLRLSARARDRSPGPGLPRVSLFVAESDLARLDGHLPHSGFEYVKGSLWNEGGMREVQVRYRGDSIYHWGNHKKSIRVKTKKGRLYRGMRLFNLIAPRSPRILENHLSYRLAARLGLITPLAESVEVSLNGNAMGVYSLVEQPKELMLRRLGRMPGDLYVGEWFNLDRYHGGVDRRVFRHPGLWEKTAVDNRRDEDFRRPLEELLTLVASPYDPASHRALAEIVDVDAFARFSVLQVLTQSTHADNVHNWRLYWDPWRGRFEPVAWDLMGWSHAFVPKRGERPRPDIISSDLHLLLHLNGDFLRARHAAFEEFFATGGDRAFLREVDEEIERVGRAIASDPNLHQYVGKTIAGPDHVIGSMRELRESIERIFEQVREDHLGGGGRVAVRALPDGRTLGVSLTGRRPVKRLLLRYRDPLGPRTPSARLRSWRETGPEEVDVSGALEVRGATLELAVSLLPGFEPVVLSEMAPHLGANHAIVDAGYYELVLDGLGDDHELLAVSADRGGSAPEPAQLAGDAGAARSRFRGAFVQPAPRPRAAPAEWAGVVAIDGVREVRGDLVLRPGTTLRMGPGAALVVRGRLLAEGTADAPIRFIAAAPEQAPWGAVALVGRGAAGSRLAHCAFEGGSGLRGDLFDYAAMLSIHDVPGVRIDRCAFRDNHIVDDAVHVVYGEVHLSNCRFEGAHLDALDLDMTRAVVDGCRIVGSGNDAIDLMGTEAVVSGALLRGSGDKGISVGERSRLLALHDRLDANAVGIQVKDGSLAVAHNVDLTANGLALDANRKNWQYGDGGTLFVYKSRIADNAVGITADAKSSIRVFDSYLDRAPEPGASVELHETVDAIDDTRPRSREIWRFPEDRVQLGNEGAWWARAAATRGASGDGHRE